MLKKFKGALNLEPHFPLSTVRSMSGRKLRPYIVEKEAQIMRQLLNLLLFWLADVFDKPLASCCPTKYLHLCCPHPITEPCNTSATAPPPMPQQSLTQERWRKPFCMKPQNSSACEAGFYFNKFTRKVEPCPDGKVVRHFFT